MESWSERILYFRIRNLDCFSILKSPFQNPQSKIEPFPTLQFSNTPVYFLQYSILIPPLLLLYTKKVRQLSDMTAASCAFFHLCCYTDHSLFHFILLLELLYHLRRNLTDIPPALHHLF
jgi:hypothetical protein